MSHNNLLFPENEIVTEVEECTKQNTDKSDKEKLKEYKEFLKSEKGITRSLKLDLTLKAPRKKASENAVCC